MADAFTGGSECRPGSAAVENVANAKLAFEVVQTRRVGRAISTTCHQASPGFDDQVEGPWPGLPRPLRFRHAAGALHSPNAWQANSNRFYDFVFCRMRNASN